MVAAFLLVTGMLGVAQLANVANRSTNSTAAHDGATNVARRVVEAARGVTPRDLTPALLMSRLRAAAPDLVDSDPADPSWTTTRRGYVYTISASVCTLDDTSDGIGTTGSHDASFCAGPAQTSPADKNPSDAKQVTATVSWSAPRSGTVKQVTAVPVGASSTLPSVSALTMTSPWACSTACPVITSKTTTSAAFSVTTTNSPQTLSWLLQGAPMATCPPSTSTCSGSGNAWAFTWNLGAPVVDTNAASVNYGLCLPGSYTYDGVSEVGAQAQDDYGLSGSPGSLSLAVNRCPPLAPPNADATGREKTIPAIDTVWETSPEGDIEGYRVYKGTARTSKTLVCPSTATAVIPIDAATECTDTSPPAYTNSAFYYTVYGVDRDPATGALREGALSSVNVNTGNRPPKTPGTLTATAGGSGTTLTWKLATPLDPDSGDTIESFRIYRAPGSVTGSPAIANRYDREYINVLCPTIANNATCTYVDAAGAGSLNTYWVTSVDTHERESGFLGPKSA